MPTEITIERIIHPHILTCTPDTLLSDAAQRMMETRCSSILVAVDGAIVGIWSEQDALALDVASLQAFHSPIAQHMSSPVKTINVNTSLGEAALRFREEKVRHFLVVDDDGKHKGIVSQTDIVINQGIEYYISLREVQSVLNRQYPIISGAAPLDEAVRRMHSGRFDALITQYPDGDYGIAHRARRGAPDRRRQADRRRRRARQPTAYLRSQRYQPLSSAQPIHRQAHSPPRRHRQRRQAVGAGDVRRTAGEH